MPFAIIGSDRRCLVVRVEGRLRRIGLNRGWYTSRGDMNGKESDGKATVSEHGSTSQQYATPLRAKPASTLRFAAADGKRRTRLVQSQYPNSARTGNKVLEAVDAVAKLMSTGEFLRAWLS